MANEIYLDGRRKYSSPQAMMWSNNSGTLSNGYYYPDGYEIGADITGVPTAQQSEFLILSDQNRSELAFSNERIQNRQRMINGNMRAYNVADKLVLSTSWNMLPSRSFSVLPNFDSTGNSALSNTTDQYTIDGGAGGLQILNWYNDHQGPFWVFLAYDTGFNRTKYNQIVQMYFRDFNYSVIKRGRQGWHDLWNINIALEEV